MLELRMDKPRSRSEGVPHDSVSGDADDEDDEVEFVRLNSRRSLHRAASNPNLSQGYVSRPSLSQRSRWWQQDWVRRAKHYLGMDSALPAPSGAHKYTTADLWLLGRCYQRQHTHRTVHMEDYKRDLARRNTNFLIDFRARIWMSYRKGFPPLPNSTLTTDRGWGCMLRTAQMMLANAFLMHYVGRNWRGEPDPVQLRRYSRILHWFCDTPSLDSPYSLHNMLQVAHQHFSKLPGTWFGPSEVSCVLRHCVNEHSELASICVVVAQDQLLVRADIEGACRQPTAGDLAAAEEDAVLVPDNEPVEVTSESDNSGSNDSHDSTQVDEQTALDPLAVDDLDDDALDEARVRDLFARRQEPTRTDDTAGPRGSTQQEAARDVQSRRRDRGAVVPLSPFKACILLIPLRLGLDELNEAHVQDLLTCLQQPQSVGIMGGKPGRSLYFVGYQDTRLVYLDPHTVQSAVDPLHDFTLLRSSSNRSYHCSRVRSVDVRDIDPSLAIAFYISNGTEFEQFWNFASTLSKTSESPLWSVADERPPDFDEFMSSTVMTEQELGVTALDDDDICNMTSTTTRADRKTEGETPAPSIGRTPTDEWALM